MEVLVEDSDEDKPFQSGFYLASPYPWSPHIRIYCSLVEAPSNPESPLPVASTQSRHAVKHLSGPHEGRMEELKDSEEVKSFCSESHLTSPSTFSLVDAPADLEGTHKEEPSITTRLAKRLGLWTNIRGANMPRQRVHTVMAYLVLAHTASEETGISKEVSQTDDTGEWGLVEPHE
ncbi:hypothetical protein PM082_024977 [Marasmius tenuissimus]|nr:hypothetical protein PM082_024977 [Marasmius tenuissimus]